MFEPLRRYADFGGRSGRTEFWLFFLFVLAANALLTMIDAGLGLGGSVERIWQTGAGSAFAMTQWHGGWLTLIFSLAMLVPSLAVAARRLHDADHSGWWLLATVLPFVGWLILFIFYVQRSWPVANRWGAPPAPR